MNLSDQSSRTTSAADCHRNGPAGSYRRITIIPICGSQLIAVPLRIRHFMPHMPKEKLRWSAAWSPILMLWTNSVRFCSIIWYQKNHSCPNGQALLCRFNVGCHAGDQIQPTSGAGTGIYRICRRRRYVGRCRVNLWKLPEKYIPPPRFNDLRKAVIISVNLKRRNCCRRKRTETKHGQRRKITPTNSRTKIRRDPHLCCWWSASTRGRNQKKRKILIKYRKYRLNNSRSYFHHVVGVEYEPVFCYVEYGLVAIAQSMPHA